MTDSQNSDPRTTDLLIMLRNTDGVFGCPSIRGRLDEAVDEIETLRIRVARLEGYSDGLAERLRQVRRAAGCDHE